MIRFLTCLLFALAPFLVNQNAHAQAATMDPGEAGSTNIPIDDSPLPGLDDDEDDLSGLGQIQLNLDLKLDQLTEDANHFAVFCELRSRMLSTDASIAEGFLYLTRNLSELNAFFESTGVRTLRPEEHIGFIGSSFNRRVTVTVTPVERDSRVSPGTEDDIPFEWTHGQCRLVIHGHVLSAGGAPRDCLQRDDSNAAVQIAACVWPGTSPSDAVISFTRPGLTSNEGG